MARGTIITRSLEDGKKRYDTVIRVHGKQRWKTFDRKKDAEDYLDRHSTDVRDGTFREITRCTFGEYAEHWKKTHILPERYKPSTMNSYLSVFETHIKPEFEHMNMQAISAAEINIFKAMLFRKKSTRKKGLSGKSVRNILMLLGRFFDDAVKDSRLRYSPMAAIEKPPKSKEKVGRALGQEEIQALLGKCQESDTYLIVLTAVLTGMRRGEVFGLRWEDVDWKSNVLRVRQTLYWRFGKYVRPDEGEMYTFVSPKSEKSRREIDLSPELKRRLRERFLCSSKAGLVFCGEDGRPRDPNGFVKHQFAKAAKAAELGKVRFHDLRHSYGCLKIEQGENIYYIQRQMGHSSIQTTIDIYGHLLDTRKPEAAAKTDEFLFGKVAAN